MPLIKRRSKMVTFRTSEQEYLEIQNLCALEGVRSVSDLARSALQSRMRAGGSKNTNSEVETMFRAIDSTMQEIGREVKRLAEGLAK